jgi:ferrous iron transport protein B
LDSSPPQASVANRQPSAELSASARRRVVLVGSPNVGKSLLFNRLTGAYAVVSNYPGTTVEITQGRARIGGEEWEVADTPGMYSLLPNSEEERIGRAMILFAEKPRAVLQVVDAKNLERMLAFTLQLREARLPLILVLNVMDEAEKRGIGIDVPRLSKLLGIPVVATVSTTGLGVEELRQAISRCSTAGESHGVKYNRRIESALAAIERHLAAEGRTGARGEALLLLQGDEEARRRLSPEAAAAVASVVAECRQRHSQPLQYLIATERQRQASLLAARVMKFTPRRAQSFAERLSAVLINPWTGFPILILALYIGLYNFVGKVGAGIAVDFLENTVFGQYINPKVEWLCGHYVPWSAVRDLIAGKYGVITLGLRYAVAIILPIVGFFFLVFSIMEDTGYLPRLALLIDRIFKKIGLSGRGVIPMVLGLGCDTMATVVTRTLPTVRERIIATFLLSLAIPCSAQLGVVFALLHNNAAALAIWAGVLILVFLLVGFLMARLLPGEPPRFYMELPPLRLPRLENIFVKTYTRIVWYLKEVIPLFLLASVMIWLGRLTGIFDLVVKALAYPAVWIGLPPKGGEIFLYGFFRRDYGAAGLYDLQQAGALSGVQVTVAAVTLTLFLPCIAQFLINMKERGIKYGIGISAFILVFSFSVGFGLNALLHALGVSL